MLQNPEENYTKEQGTKGDTWGTETGWPNQWLLSRLAKSKYAINATQVHSLSLFTQQTKTVKTTGQY